MQSHTGVALLLADVMPFPNYYVLAANIRYYLQHGVRGMCE